MNISKLDFTKVCGKHAATYEAYYKLIDPKGSGGIEAMTAAKFLKKSGLSDVVLSRIWDLSDPNGRGFLDKPGFFVALKLVSLAQAGQVFNMANIYNETDNPPKCGELPKTMPSRIQTVPVSSGGVATGDWSIKVIDRLKYEQLFETLRPVNGVLPGNKVKGVLMDSKLPTDTLGKIWDLADQDRDGNLDKHEFIVAMHLVYQTLEKRTVPDTLPPELRKAVGPGMPPPPKPVPPMPAVAPMPRAPSGEGFGDSGFVANFPKDIAPPPVPPIPSVMPTRLPPVGGTGTTPPLIATSDPLIPIAAPPSAATNVDWVVTPVDLKRYEIIFRTSDADKDGLVSGLEVRNVFLQTGVPQNCLAHIWALCDTNQSGKLTLEQFALAMWMVERKQKGIEPPQLLSANMVPPSMRSIISGVEIQPQEPKPTYSNPELEMISKEIAELAKERRALELEITQKETDIRVKKGEVRSLQGELDTLMATHKQLENQRGEAQKRLDDLQAQREQNEKLLLKLSEDLEQLRNEVNKLRDQCHKQEETINEQEGEINSKRSELQKLKDEETSLQKEYDENNRELQKLTNHLQNTQLQISSVRSMVTELLEVQRQMTDALLLCRAANENQDGELVKEYQLKIEPDFDEARKILEKKIEEPKEDPFEDNKNAENLAKSNGFTSNNGFGSDAFSSGGGVTHSGFDDSFNATSGFDSGGFDAFGSGSAFGQQKDPFGGGSDAFGANKSNAITPEPGKDDFGSDPFAALHAPTGQGQVLSPNAQKSGPPPRPESPSPALPPKKSKVPPPRPAPPRPLQGPPRPAGSDAFGGSSSGSGGFADFADFDNKSIDIPPSAPAPVPVPVVLSVRLPPPATSSSAQSSTMSAMSITSTATATNLLSTLNSNNNNKSGSNSASSGSNLSFLDLYNTNANNMTTSTSNAASTIIDKYSSLRASSVSSSSSSIKNSFVNNPTATTINNHSRSNTPMQQAATGHFNDQNNDDDVFKSPSPFNAMSIKTTTTTTTTAAAGATTGLNAEIKGPTDFSDDPFKDYRYEDVFSIKDPFADDDVFNEDPEKIFQADLSSDEEEKTQKALKSISPLSAGGMAVAADSSNSVVNSGLIQQMDAFNLNSSLSSINSGDDKKAKSHSEDNFPSFEAFSTKSVFRDMDNKNNLATTTTSNTKTDTFFNAFNDNFEINSNKDFQINTSQYQSTKSANDLFANFDSTELQIQNNNNNPLTVMNAAVKATSPAPNAFADAFGASIGPMGGLDKKLKDQNITTNLFDDDGDFGKDFSGATTTITDNDDSSFDHLKNNNKNLTNHNLNDKNFNSLSDNHKNNNSNANFTKFDAFNNDDSFAFTHHQGSDGFAKDFSNIPNNAFSSPSAMLDLPPSASASSSSSSSITKVKNQTTLPKIPNIDKKQFGADGSSSGALDKLPEKFKGDYSKPESFEDDLQEAIKRSMIDQ